MKKGRVAYDQAFYDAQLSDSFASARRFLAHLWPFVSPRSVVDVGCGRGPWLSACRELGSVELYGYDGPWNSQSNMVDSAITFMPVDLEDKFDIRRPVDLAMSLEVAEHLSPAAASGFVETLASASPVVLFGAAFPGQGGTEHVNEQPASYWAEKFSTLNYIPYDLFRPSLWADKAIPFWYRQNTFLYVRAGCESERLLQSAGYAGVTRSFMDCVHPEMFERQRRVKLTWKGHLKDFLPSLWRATKRM